MTTEKREPTRVSDIAATMLAAGAKAPEGIIDCTTLPQWTEKHQAPSEYHARGNVWNLSKQRRLKRSRLIALFLKYDLAALHMV